MSIWSLAIDWDCLQIVLSHGRFAGILDLFLTQEKIET